MVEAWSSALKAFAIYRDGTKRSALVLIKKKHGRSTAALKATDTR
jgi:hypothetical protein